MASEMKFSRRTSLLMLLAGLILFGGILLRSVILDNLVTPIALVAWAVWRVLQSVDQTFYWGLLTLSALLMGLVRLVRLTEAPIGLEQTSPPDSNATLERIDYWRTSIRLTGLETSKSNILEHNLAEMLAALYASQQSQTPSFEIYNALKRRQRPLPETIYAFLFGAESSSSRRSIKQILQAIGDMPRRRIRRWTGRETAAYYQSLEQVLTFMESSLEKNHDHECFDTPHH
jgi:hypothetical protein